MKSAVVVLTRGYPRLEQYVKLIQRNMAVEKHLRDKTIDIVIFHEGNITQQQQEYIQSFTPSLHMIFTDIKKDGLAFSDIKRSLPISPSVQCPFGYRHMCAFWFTDFWSFCKDYDRIIRIDEDCNVEFDIQEILGYLDSNVAVFGKWDRDEAFVTQGLNTFTLEFLRKQCDVIPLQKEPSGPYTNVIALNLVVLRNNTTVMKYVDAIKESNNIYIWRWGDLPLLGDILHYIFPKECLLTHKIKYYHESHNAQVN